VERWRRGEAEGSLAWEESFAKGGGGGKLGREERR